MSRPYERALLDTSVVVDYPAQSVSELANSAAVSTITLAELAFGLHTDDPLTNAARAQRYQWIRTTFATIGFEPDTAAAYGALCASVRQSGRDPRPRRFDLLIAAVAVAAGTPLITRNAADFTGIHDTLTVLAVP